MNYVLTDKNAVDLEVYWYGQYPSLEEAIEAARNEPRARYILEYRPDISSGGQLPTGNAWPVIKEKEVGE